MKPAEYGATEQRKAEVLISVGMSQSREVTREKQKTGSPI